MWDHRDTIIEIHELYIQKYKSEPRSQRVAMYQPNA